MSSMTAGALLTASPLVVQAATSGDDRGKIKVGVIGCGSVSRRYFPHLLSCPYLELVSTCDIIPERARMAAEQLSIPHHYPHIDQMLGGAHFDLLVNLTDMQEHERLNRQALEAGRHVFSEKPMANSLAGGNELLELARNTGLRLWGAPTVVQSHQFAFMAETLANGSLGAVAAAHGSYGHLGPDWAEFFYTEGGGSLVDLGVYNLSLMTGLLGPARAVTAMTSVVTPKRVIHEKGDIMVRAEDNAMVLIDHGNGVLSHVQCGFNYFTAHEHDHTQRDHHSVSITGTGGQMMLAGYDWAPYGVDLATSDSPKLTRHAAENLEYRWECGASLAAECLATGKEPLFTPEHALHVIEIMNAVRQSQEDGKRVPMKSTFQWPIVRNVDLEA